MPIPSLLCTFLRTLLAELHAHALDRAADLSMWAWQLMAPSISNSHSCSHSNRYDVKSGPHTHSFHRAGAAHPHLPHRVCAPPHLEFGRSPSGCGENFNLLSI